MKHDHEQLHLQQGNSDEPADSSRRNVLMGALAAGVAATALPSVSRAAKMPMRLDDAAWNRDAYARLVGNMDFGELKQGWYSGTVMGMRDNEPLKPLMGFEGFSMTRLIDNGDGTYQKLLRETVYYTDLATGDVLETWYNPYIDEEVKVVPVTNDPFNIVIEKYYPAGPTYGGLREQDVKRKPMILPFRVISDDTVALSTDIHLYYPSALQPEEWPRESAGKFVRVSEMFRYVIPRDQLEDPRREVHRVHRCLVAGESRGCRGCSWGRPRAIRSTWAPWAATTTSTCCRRRCVPTPRSTIRSTLTHRPSGKSRAFQASRTTRARRSRRRSRSKRVDGRQAQTRGVAGLPAARGSSGFPDRGH
jgi:hypothetical protein